MMKTKDNIHIAVIGATGLVGQKLLTVLEERDFPMANIRPVASERSAGKAIQAGNQQLTIRSIEEALADKPDVALFSAGGDVAKQWAPSFKAQGCTVIDNSSAWRLEPGILLIVPEINGAGLNSGDRLIANPNCSTIQLALALHPLQKHFGLERVLVSTYQSVTGSGQQAVDQLMAERSGKQPDSMAYPHPIDMNCLPHCDDFLENGYTMEEMKVVQESRKILQQEALPITATAVRVPVTGGHSESVNIELQQSASIDAIREVLQATPGIRLMDNPAQQAYPMPLNAADRDEVLVGRIRQDPSRSGCWHLWVVADNLRKGAATNAVQILETLLSKQIIRK